MRTTWRNGALSLIAVTGLACGGLAAPMIAAGPAAASSGPTPVLHYSFDQTSGTTITDDSGNGYDGTLTGAGASFGNGELTLPGGANGSGAAYVSIPNTPFVGQQNLTVSLWLQNTTGAGNYTGAYVGNSSTNNGYWLFNPDNPSGYIKSVLTGATAAAPSGSPWSTEVGPGSTNSATTGHTATSDLALYTAVIDGTNHLESFYLNGSLVGTATLTADVSSYGDASSLVAYLGKSPYPDPLFSGSIDDYAVYQSALSASQVQSLYAVHALAQLQASGVVLAGTSSSLPTLGGLITGWTSSDPKVTVGADGFSATVAANATGTATLSATAGGASYPVTVTLATSPLAIPAQISGDLPSTVGGHAITWDDGHGGTIVSADGHVTRPPAGAGATPVHLTATIAGSAAPVSADSSVLDQGGSIATYTKLVTTTNGQRSDVLAYAGDRRAEALYVSAKDAGAGTWQPLNRSQAILYVKWSGTQAGSPNNKMGSPSLFRDASGNLALVASQANATGSVYVWDSNGTTFSNQRLVTIATDGSVVTNPTITWDAASQTYAVAWTDGTGGGHLTRLTSLTSSSTPSAAVPDDATTRGLAQTTGLPSFADATQLTSLSLSSSEYHAFYNAYVDLQNTGVTVPSTTVAQGASLTGSSLPQATLAYNDGSTKKVNVDWSASDLAKVDTTKPGTYQVSGTVQQDDFAYPFIQERADPDVVYNPTDGYYYATGSYYPPLVPGAPGNITDSYGNVWSPDQAASTSYRAIGLRRATTIAGLKTAPEYVVAQPGSTSMTGYSPYIWAPELHKINGTWYLLVGMRSGSSTNFPNTTVLIPFTGTDADVAAGKMLDQSYWGAPIALAGAPAWDVTYFERQENGHTQGYYVLPVLSPMKFQIVKAKMGAGVVPQFDGTPVTIYSSDQPWQYGKDSYTETDPGTSDHDVIEAPFVTTYGDQLYLSFSAATVDKYYSLGVMRAAPDADLTDPASWTVDGYPLLDSYDTIGGAIGGEPQAGPGHNALIQDAAGNLALVYHARPFPDPHTDAGAGGLYDPDRSTAIKSVNVRANGDLDLSMTADQEVAPANRTVTATVVVTASGAGAGTPPSGGSSGTTSPVASHTTVAVNAKLLARSVHSGARLVRLTLSVRVTAADGSAVTGTVKVRVGGVVRTVVVHDGVGTLTLKVARGKVYRISATYAGSATVLASAGSVRVRVGTRR